MTTQTPSAPTTEPALPREVLYFRLAAHVEACTWAGLLVGMLFKYVVGHNAIGVHVFGPIHGCAFLAYVGTTIWASRTQGWSRRLTLAGLAASIPPLMTWPFERYATRRP